MTHRFSRFAHFLRVLIALGSVFITVEAHAMAVAPMCDEVGASVAAPIPALPNATGELRALTSCNHETDALRVAPPANERAAFERGFDPGERALAVLVSWAAPPTRTLPVGKPDEAPVAVEHRKTVYRPPRF